MQGCNHAEGHPGGLIEPMLGSAGVSRCALSRNSHRTIDPHALKIPAPNGAESTLTENLASPFQAEPRHVRGLSES
jgi:hypothetical protein